MRYLHTMVRVTSLEQSLDFYCNKLGLTEVKRYDNEKGRFTLVFLAAPGDEERALVELTYNWDPDAHGSCLGFASPFCSSSMEMLSGERTNAMRPSRGGRLMVTPAFISRSQQRVDVVDLEGQMPEIAALAVALGVPVVGQLQERGARRRLRLVVRCGQEHQRVAAASFPAPADLLHAELVAIEIQALIDVGDANHGMEIPHEAVLSVSGRHHAPVTVRAASRQWRRPG